MYAPPVTAGCRVLAGPPQYDKRRHQATTEPGSGGRSWTSIDRALWPVQHPGVVLDAVPSIAHGACLGCQWTNFVREFSGTGPGNQYIGNDQADLDNVLLSPWLSASAAGWRSNYAVQQPR